MKRNPKPAKRKPKPSYAVLARKVRRLERELRDEQDCAKNWLHHYEEQSAETAQVHQQLTGVADVILRLVKDFITLTKERDALLAQHHDDK